MPKKIFELANELNIGAIDLVEKLKGYGFAVRNHMNSLSDDDLEKVAKLLGSEEQEAVTKKKVVKKKVVKKKTKKTAKKTTSKKVQTVIAKEASSTKNNILKKKTVIRKKAKKDEDLEVLDEVQADQIDGVEVEIRDEAIKSEKGETKSEGLRVVSAPEVKEKELERNNKPAEKEKGVYKEKVHKFTPVYIPPEEEKPKEEKVSNEEEGGDKDKSKKRLGGLASMMSGKLKTGSKSKDIVLSRSEEELKSYTALGNLGKPLYTQVKRKKVYSGPSSSTEITEVKESKRVLHLHNGGTVLEIAQKLSVKFDDFADRLLDINLLVKPDDYIGMILANKIANLFNYKVENAAFDEDAVIGKQELTKEEKTKLPLRNPIITIMGHVDHGKTTLLDHIRKAKVAAGEAGGITQHIGAYSVNVGESTLTFLDTPGHAAFASMRQRGAQVTDLVVLVVAADDGVMPQTKESVRFCQQAEVPLIVAVNKMDKEGVNPDRVKQELTEFHITPEEWGGDTQFLPISALKGEGVDELLEAIALQAEMLELRANPEAKTEGVIIESKIEQGRGPVATVLIQEGTLKKGESIVVGECFGRARSLMDHTGKQLKQAGPSTPVQILGLDNAPNPGDILNIVKTEREAKKIVSNRRTERKEIEAVPSQKKLSLEDFFAMSQEDVAEKRELNLIIRADVNGSFEAIKQSIEPLSNKEVAIKVIGGGIGPITDSDVALASSSQGFIIGFNMRPMTTARKIAEDKGVDIKTYSVIYELINDIKLAMEGLLEPERIEQFIGRAEVKETFVIPKLGVIAGSMVIDGKIEKGCNVRLLRDGKIIHDGLMSSLKRFKEDVKDVGNGYECGIGLENYNDIKVGDLFEAYKLLEKKRTLEDVEKEEKEAAAKEAAAKEAAAKEAAALALKNEELENSREQSL